MNIQKSFIVYRKELLETLRDKKTLVIMVVIPIVLYPLLFMLASQILTIGAKNLEGEQSVIALTATIPQNAKEMLLKEKNLKVIEVKDLKAAIEEQTIAAYIDSQKNGITQEMSIYYDGAVERSRLAQSRITQVLTEYKKLTIEGRLKQAGVDINVLEAVKVDSKNTAPPTKMGGMFLGSIIPMLLIITTALGAMYPAIDVTAGEKERGTLETILTVPVKKNELFLGKYLTVSTIAVITAALNLLSMLMVYSLGLIQMDALMGNIEFSLSIGTALILFILTVPVALFISALTMSACLFAKSFKDAQNIVTPIYILLMIPSIFAMAPGIKLNSVLVVIPVLNVCLAFKDILLQSFAVETLFIAFGSNLLFAFLGYMMVLRFFQAEEILFSDGKGFNILTRRSEIKPSLVFETSDALVIASIVMVGLIYVGSMLEIKFGNYGILLTQWVFILLPVLLSMWYFKVNIKESLHLYRFSTKAILGALIFCIGMIGMGIYVSRVQMFFFPEMNEVSKALEKVLDFDQGGVNFWFGFFIFAVTPAICEEVFFRGMLLSSLKKKMSPMAAITIISVLFGIYHLNIFRAIPTAVLGIFITFAVYHTKSIFVGMILHVINNGMSVVLVDNPTWSNKIDEVFKNPWMDGTILFLVLASTLIGGRILLKTKSSGLKEVVIHNRK